MKDNNVLFKIWHVIYPLLAYFLLDLLSVWAVSYLMAPTAGPENKPVFGENAGAIASVIFLVLSIGMCYLFYNRDWNQRSEWIYHKPLYMLLLAVTGMLAAHGLSALVSLFQIDNIIGNYTEIENNIFSASPVLVVIQTVILAPVSEELLFRGLLYKRLRYYFDGYWIPALISSAVFGLYHMNLAQGVFAFLFGLLACAVYEKIHNLLASMLLHIGGNLLSVILVYLGFDYPSLWLHIVCMAFALAAAWALYYFLIRPAEKETAKEIG